ncbi:MAG: lysophospholipase [Lewinellaceae bacterium]|nr:lysophospholipase [Lewinellaceae bacterium]MCB9288403.1 lysophospholipase [Lewinellaceae bacterium]
MQEIEFSWETRDGLNIYGKEWKADNPSGVICLVHGLGEHINRYGHFARFFTAHGYSIIGYDRRGHGRSGGQKGHAPDADVLLDEVAHLLIEAEIRYRDFPVFLYGQSQGGLLVLAYALKRHPNIQGIIASSPWIRLSFEPAGVTIFLGKLAHKIFPAFSQPNGLDTKSLSRDPAVVRAYEEDPLVHDRITAAMGIAMLAQSRWLDSYSGPFPAPLLIMHGTSDKITSPVASREFSERLEGDVTYRPWDGFYHEIHNEPGKEEPLEFALDWLNQHRKMKKLGKQL